MNGDRFDERGLVHDAERLKELQALPLDRKVGITMARIIEWYKHFDGKVCLSFSGGKDSTALLHIARSLFPDIPAVFVDTGLEYPEVRTFAKSFDNVVVLRPSMPFHEVVKKVGYPIISKEVAGSIGHIREHLDAGDINQNLQRYKQLFGLENYGKESRYNKEKWQPLLYVDFRVSDLCCAYMKKEPMKKYHKESGRRAMTAMTTAESQRRESAWIKNGCNAFESKEPRSMPMAFWLEDDILEYLRTMNIKIASVYGDIVEKDGQLAIPGFRCPLRTTGCNRTGCMFCAFGAHLEKGVTRFQRLKETHPKQYKYCIEGGAYDIDGFWIPNKEGLGLRKVFDELNEIYGDDFIKYE